MEKNFVSYYDGTSARPQEVWVLVNHSGVHLYNEEDKYLKSFPLSNTIYNKTGNRHFLYLDPTGLQYLQFPEDHPLSFTIAKELPYAKLNWAQRLMKQRIIVLVPVLLGLIIGVYFLIISLIPYIGSKMISIEREIELGDKLHSVMLDQAAITGARVDSAGTIELQAFADQLNLSKTYPIRVTLVNSNIVNAYALPGGNIVVYSGILEKIKTAEELAALLSHESTHVNERHSLKSLLRSAANGLIVSILLSDASGITGTLVSNVETLNGLSYSRSLEKEADQQGMEILLANGVDLEGMRDLMRTLEAEGDVPGSISFLSSHPLTKERIQAATKFIKDHPQSIEEREDLKAQFEKLHSLPVISED